MCCYVSCHISVNVIETSKHFACDGISMDLIVAGVSTSIKYVGELINCDLEKVVLPSLCLSIRPSVLPSAHQLIG